MKTCKLLLGLFLPLLLAAQPKPVFELPAELMKGANEVIQKETYQLEINSEEGGDLHYRRVVSILNQNSSANIFYIHYNDGQRVRKIDVVLYDAQGQEIRELRRDEIKDYAAVSGSNLYEDSRVKAIEVHHSRYPYTIAIEYQRPVEGIEFIVGNTWQQSFHQGILQSEFKVSAPNDLPIQYKTYQTEQEPEIQQDGKTTHYRWRFQHLPPVAKEPYAPPASELLPRLTVLPSRYEAEGFEGQRKNWSDFGQFIHQLWAGRGELPPATARKVQELTEGLQSNAEKVAVLYRFLQENTRYVSIQLGIGGWQPFDARYVVEHKYGDCKALTNYMGALLEAAGIPSRPALIFRAAKAPKLDPEFPAPRFNHVILHLPEEDMWLECTSKHNPPNYIGSDNQDRRALLIKEEGSQLMRTPRLEHLDNIRSGRLDVALDEAGNAHIRGRYRRTGTLQEWHRYFLYQWPEEKMKAHFIENISLPAVSLEQLNFDIASGQAEIGMQYQLTSQGLASQAGKRLFLPLNPLGISESVPEAEDERRFPIVSHTTYTFRDTVSIQLPEEYKVESVKTGMQTLESPFGYYQINVQQEEGRLTFFRLMQRQAFREPASAYEDFRAFFQQVSKLDQSMAVLVRKKT